MIVNSRKSSNSDKIRIARFISDIDHILAPVKFMDPINLAYSIPNIDKNLRKDIDL